MATKKSVRKTAAKSKVVGKASTAKPVVIKPPRSHQSLSEESWKRMWMIGQGAIDIAKKYGLIKQNQLNAKKVKKKR